MAAPITSAEPTNPKQVRFVELLADPDDFRDIREKAREAGYSDGYGYQLARDPTFAEWVVRRCRQLVRAKLPQIYQGLARDAMGGNLEPIDRHRAAKIVMQATGEIQSNGVTINDNRAVNIVFPERLAVLFAERRELLREVGIIEAGTGEEAPEGGASHRGNGNGNGNGATD